VVEEVLEIVCIVWIHISLYPTLPIIYVLHYYDI